MKGLDLYKPVAESISELLYPFAEVVIHNLETNCIEAIFNNKSKRKCGDDSNIDDVHSFDSGPDCLGGPFLKEGFYGRNVKYTTSVLRDQTGKAIGLMCINFDLEPMQSIQNVFSMFMSNHNDSTQIDQLFHDDWKERIQSFVVEYLKQKNRAPDQLTKQERITLVKALIEAGAFKARKAPEFTAKVLGVTRATIYNYIKEIDKTD